MGTPFVPTLRQGEHVACIGTTGSGKSELVKAYFKGRDWSIIVDSKHDMHLPGYVISRNPLSIINGRTRRRIIYRPDNPHEIGDVIQAAYDRKGWSIDFDEVYAMSTRGTVGSYPRSYIASLTRGRSRGITDWSCMQRPRFAPLEAMSESVHFFVFSLANADDQKRVADFTIPEMRDAIDSLRGEPKHRFVYFNRFEGALHVSAPLRKEVLT